MAKGKAGGLKKLLYDSDTGEVLGRTGSSWGNIIIFYIIFFICLGSFFVLMLYLFYLTRNAQIPTWQFGDHIGLGFRPTDGNSDSTLIWYNRSQKADYEYWSGQLSGLVNFTAVGSDVTKCAMGNSGIETYRDKNKNNEQIASCFIDNKQFGECSPDKKFGYQAGQPCILLKLNRLYGWKPIGFGLNGQPYSQDQFNQIFKSDMMQLEKVASDNPDLGLIPMPKYLQDYIRGEVAKPEHSVQWKTDFLNSVFLSCDGEEKFDTENMGQITNASFFPYPYIPSYYFPFTNQKSYQPPIVMVKIKPLPNILININCKAWAKNIKHNKPDQLGMVHFELMVD